MREARIIRKTKETDIKLSLNIDGADFLEIDSGIGFFDHMLTAVAVHGGFGLSLTCKGDLQVDGHHTCEDIGIVFGQALARCLNMDIGNAAAKGVRRYGDARIPMDETLAECVLDLSGRGLLVYDAPFAAGAKCTGSCGGFDLALCEEFFRAVAVSAGITLHLRVLYGRNGHHKAEALFKAFAHALAQAVTPAVGLLSTK